MNDEHTYYILYMTRKIYQYCLHCPTNIIKAKIVLNYECVVRMDEWMDRRLFLFHAKTSERIMLKFYSNIAMVSD